MTYADADAYLHALPRFADQGAAAFKPGLERVEALLAAMGDPHRAYPSVHVAGTNGKGSTASMIAAVVRAAGRRVGLATSPHLLRLGERLRVDGAPAPDAWLAAAVARHRALFDALAPSFFEALVALGFLYFAEAEVDVAVVEVGLGGRLDATNVLAPQVCVVTRVGLDHTDLLGDTLALVAAEKAGIVKPGVPVVTSAAPDEAFETIRAVAAQRGAPLHVVEDEVAVTLHEARPDALVLDAATPRRTYRHLRLDLGGRHQAGNAALALRAAELLLPDLDEGAVRTGLGAVRTLSGLRGRLEVVQARPLIVADVAHNPEGVAAALAAVQAAVPEGRVHVLLGLLRDKDAAGVAALLRGLPVFAAELPGSRAWPPEALAEVLRAGGVRVEGTGRPAAGAAWFAAAAAPGDALLAVGSHQVAAALLDPAAPPPPLRPSRFV